VWNTESGAEYSLNGPVGQVNALTAVKDLLFAGVEVNYFANSLEFFYSLTIVKAICFYLFKEEKKSMLMLGVSLDFGVQCFMHFVSST
jgi:hypothetical protein